MSAQTSDVPLENRGDDELMLLARGGRQGAFDILVRRHQRFVLCLTSKYLADKQSVQDVAQSAFLELYRYLPRCTAQGRFKQLLARIVLNQCCMAGRRSSTRRAMLEGLAGEARFEPRGLPDDRLIARERRKATEHAVSLLSDKLRPVVLLRFSGHLSYQEIADTLQLPIGTVKSRLAAGIDRLRELVDKTR